MSKLNSNTNKSLGPRCPYNNSNSPSAESDLSAVVAAAVPAAAAASSLSPSIAMSVAAVAKFSTSGGGCSMAAAPTWMAAADISVGAGACGRAALRGVRDWPATEKVTAAPLAVLVTDAGATGNTTACNKRTPGVVGNEKPVQMMRMVGPNGNPERNIEG